jgi:hypothetical protein
MLKKEINSACWDIPTQIKSRSVQLCPDIGVAVKAVEELLAMWRERRATSS